MLAQYYSNGETLSFHALLDTFLSYMVAKIVIRFLIPGFFTLPLLNLLPK